VDIEKKIIQIFVHFLFALAIPRQFNCLRYEVLMDFALVTAAKYFVNALNL